MIARPKVLLLDVDGVVFNHPVVLNRVASRVVKYVADELHMNMKEAEHVNKLLYSHYGHTFLGLQKVYNIDKSHAHFSYNVYDPELISSIKQVQYDKDIVAHSKQVQKLIAKCEEKGIPVYLFSNAPHAWCKAVSQVTGIHKYLHEDNIISSDHAVFQHNGHDGLKPSRRVYDTLYRFISHSQHDDMMHMVFVDDSFQNLMPVIGDPMWQPVYYHKEGAFIRNHRLTSIHDIADVTPLI
jgi:FMN phosphatase YigB (HAD superfamily)